MKYATHPVESKQSFVHSRINNDIKEQASLILDKIGLNVSDAIRLFLNQVVMRKGIPFSVNIPNAETIAAMGSADRGEDLEEVTLDQLRLEFQNERKNKKERKKEKNFEQIKSSRSCFRIILDVVNIDNAVRMINFVLKRACHKALCSDAYLFTV